jgi:hypothetical protein
MKKLFYIFLSIYKKRKLEIKGKSAMEIRKIIQSARKQKQNLKITSHTRMRRKEIKAITEWI